MSQSMMEPGCEKKYSHTKTIKDFALVPMGVSPGVSLKSVVTRAESVPGPNNMHVHNYPEFHVGTLLTFLNIKSPFNPYSNFI